MITFSENFPSWAKPSKLSVTIEDMNATDISYPIIASKDVVDVADLSWWIEVLGNRFYCKSLIPDGYKDDSSPFLYHYTLEFEAELRRDFSRFMYVDLGISDNLPIIKSYANIFKLTIREFADKLNANLRFYGLSDRWVITVHESLISDQKLVSIEDAYLWDVLQRTTEFFGDEARWTVIDKGTVAEIAIGKPSLEIDHVFEYGGDTVDGSGGLVKIERTSSIEKITSILMGRGGTRNIPQQYFKFAEGDFPKDSDCNSFTEAMNIKNLMPKGFRDYNRGWNFGMEKPTESEEYNQGARDRKASTADKKVYRAIEWVKSPDAIKTYGENWSKIEPNEEIYPSIQGITAEELNAAGLITTTTGRIDEIIAFGNITGSDISEGTFDIWIKDIGFDPGALQHWGSEDMTVAFTSGWAAISDDYNFKVLRQDGVAAIVRDDSKTYNGVKSAWRVTLIKSDAELSTTGKMIPNADSHTQPVPGDTFFFFNIELPWQYVRIAEQRQTDFLKGALSTLDKDLPTYTVKPDKIFCNNFTEKSKLLPGSIIKLRNTRLIDGSYQPVHIQSVTLSFDWENQMLPDWELVVSDKILPVLNPIRQIESDLSSLTQSMVSASQIESSIVNVCDRRYLKKYTDDIMNGNLKVAVQKGVKSTNFDSNLRAGFNLFTDANGRGILQCNKIEAEELEVDNLTYNTIRAVGGKIVVSKAWITVSRVEEIDTEVRFYYKPSDGMQLWRIGDQPRMANGGRFFWGLVVNVSDINTIQEEHFIACSKSILTGNIASVREADEFVLYGHRGDDATRKNLTLIDSGSADNPYPSIAQYYGIDSFDLSNIENKRPILISNKVVIGSEKQGMIIDPQNRIFKIIGINLEMTNGESVTVDDIVDKVDNIEVGGVNLLSHNPNNWQMGLYLGATGIYSANIRYICSKFTIPISPNTEYVLQRDADMDNFGYGVLFYDSNDNYLGLSYLEPIFKGGRVFKTPTNATQVKFNYSSNPEGTQNWETLIKNIATDKIALYRGNKIPDWTAHPEDTQVQIDNLIDRNNAAANDNIITIAEKAQLRNDWIELQKTYASLRESAVSIGVSVTAVDAGYAGISEAFGSSWVNIGLAKDYTFPTSGALTKDNYLQRFSNWQVAVQQLSNDIAQKKVDNIEIGVNLVTGLPENWNQGYLTTDIPPAIVPVDFYICTLKYTEVDSISNFIVSVNRGIIRRVFIACYDANKQYLTTINDIDNFKDKTPFKFPANTQYILFELAGMTGTKITPNDIIGAKLQLSKGNKVTEWTPSQEDIQSEIDQANKTPTYIGVFEDLTKPFYPINSKDRQDGVRYQSKFYKFTGASKTAISTWDSSQWTEWDMDGASFVNIATNTLLAEDAHLGNWRIKGNSIASKYTFDTDGEIPKAKMDGEQGSLDFHFGANKDYTCQNVRVFMGHKGLDGAGACSPNNDYPIFVRSMGDVVNGVYDYGNRTDISWGDVFVKGNKRSSVSQSGVNGKIFNDYSMYVGNTIGMGTNNQPAVGLYCEASPRGYGALIKELMVHGLNTAITTTTASSLVISTSATVINCTNTGTQTLTMPSYPSDGKLYIITKRSTAGTILLTVPSTQDGFTLSSGSNSTSININAGQSYLVQYSSISKRWNLTQL